MKYKPRIGIIGMAFPDNDLGEEMCADKTREMVMALIQNNDIVVVEASIQAYTENDIKVAATQLEQQGVDVILALLCSFVPDYFIVKILEICDKPVFLWAVEREMKCISLVGGCLVTGALYNLGKNYTLQAADIDSTVVMEKLLAFSRAGMLLQLCKQSKIGVSGGKNNIMLSMQWDEFALRKNFGLKLVNIAIEELYEKMQYIPDPAVKAEWEKIKGEVGSCTVSEEDGLCSTRLYLAALELIRQEELAGYSINCFPALKSKICLAVARLNDNLVAAGCEGDLNSTFMMFLLEALSGKAAFNGDFLRMYHDDNAVLFSHCGAGAFSLANDMSKVELNASIETHNGCAVCYATHATGKFTLLNMMTGESRLRVSALLGEAMETDLEYKGTPIKVGFGKNIDDILQNVIQFGCGHHWSGVEGDFVEEIKAFCGWCGIEFNLISQ